MIASVTSRFAITELPPASTRSPSSSHDDGWLGQVPPPSTPAPTPPAPEPTTYAIPQLAPEPWKADPVLPGTDPTLFG